MAHRWTRGCSTLASSLMGNQFATGGVAVLLTGAGLAAARSISHSLWELALRRCVVRAEFDSRDDSYRWLVSWLATHPSQQEVKHFSISTTLRRIGYTQLSDDTPPSDEPMLLIPTGTSLLTYDGRWLFVQREREQDRGAANPAKERESLTLHLLLGSRGQLVKLVEEAREAYLSRELSRTRVHFVDEYGSWACVSSSPSRSLHSIVLDDPLIAPKLRADCERFLGAQQWYATRGIPYRRGYLLHGPPGKASVSLV